MSHLGFLLSSPCGYYGEPALQHVRSLLASALWQKLDTPDDRPVRSHFVDIRIWKDPSRGDWICEAGLLDPYDARQACRIWLPFARLVNPSPPRAVDDEGVVMIPGKLVNVAEIAKSRIQLKEAEDAALRGFAINERYVDTCRVLDPLRLKNPSFSEVDKWLEQHHLKLQRLEVDRWTWLCDEVGELVLDSLRKLDARRATHLDGTSTATASGSGENDARSFNEVLAEIEQLVVQGQGPEPFIPDAFVRQCSETLEFFTRVVKLLWYIGRNGWESVPDLNTARYPRTRAPSRIWSQLQMDEDIISIGRLFQSPQIYGSSPNSGERRADF